jgi:hypothetical protein
MFETAVQEKRSGILWARSAISMTIRSSPQAQFIDNQGLDRAQNCLDSGGSLDEACGWVDPKYRSMNKVMQKLFQKAVGRLCSSGEHLHADVGR